MATGKINNEYTPVHVVNETAVVNIFAGNEYGSFFITEKPDQILWYGVYFKPAIIDGIHGTVKDIVSVETVAIILESKPHLRSNCSEWKCVYI